jgi:hypothetical protein
MALRICHAARYQSPRTLTERVQVPDSVGWRAAETDELAAMCRADGQSSDVSIIAIPKHLLKRWWQLAESSDGDLTHITAGFEGYAREIAEYFEYKNWTLPPSAVMEVLVADGERESALQTSQATRFSGGVGKLSACINLGDENLGIVLGAEPVPIRVMLEPGEGVMLPPAGVRWTPSTLAGADPAVMLLIGSLSTD